MLRRLLSNFAKAYSKGSVCTTENMANRTRSISFSSDLRTTSERDDNQERATYAIKNLIYGTTPENHFGPKAGLQEKSGHTITVHDPSAQKLQWYKRPTSVLVVKKNDPSVMPAFTELCSWMVKHRGLDVYVEDQVLAECSDSRFCADLPKVHSFCYDTADLTDKIDLIVCLGGDGTLLYASSLFQASVPPVLAFHLGSLGFLMAHNFTDFRSSLDKTLEGQASLTLRTRLHCTLTKGHSTTTTEHQVLNEVVVDRGPSPFICNLDLYIENRCVTQVQGDGLIISTPTGSTAYSMAAGANMMHPSVPALLLAPICPHSLSFRPIVLPAGVQLCVRPSNLARSSAWVSFDGRDRQEMTSECSLKITTSPYPVPSVSNADPTQDWFAGLADCLHWNVRLMQKPPTTISPPSDSGLSTSSSSSNGSSSGGL